jgi:hypothetical protein
LAAHFLGIVFMYWALGLRQFRLVLSASFTLRGVGLRGGMWGVRD